MADQQALYTFSQWVAGCSGNEKQEAQTFVQKLPSCLPAINSDLDCDHGTIVA